MRNRNDDVPLPDAACAQRQMQCLCAAADSDGMPNADVRCELAFKAIHLFAQDVPPTVEYSLDGSVNEIFLRCVRAFWICNSKHSSILSATRRFRRSSSNAV